MHSLKIFFLLFTLFTLYYRLTLSIMAPYGPINESLTYKYCYYGETHLVC